MVARSKKRLTVIVFSALLPCLPLLSGSCSADILGLFSSNDLDERFGHRNTFKLLTPEDRELLLPAGEEYSFIVLSDPHIRDGDDRGLGGLIGAVDTDGIGTDDKFVVVTGDITQNGKRGDLERFTDFVKKLKEEKNIPCYPVLGNHDIFFDSWDNWRDLIGSSCYRIGASGSGTTLFILDSANGFFGFRQLDWLEHELGRTSGHVFIFTHTNFFVKGFGISDRHQITDVMERARVISLLEGRADAFFSGHLHRRVEREFGGVKYVTIEDFRDDQTWCRVYVTQTGIRYEFNNL